jgi:hypothetical protein
MYNICRVYNKEHILCSDPGLNPNRKCQKHLSKVVVSSPASSLTCQSSAAMLPTPPMVEARSLLFIPRAPPCCCHGRALPLSTAPSPSSAQSLPSAGKLLFSHGARHWPSSAWCMAPLHSLPWKCRPRSPLHLPSPRHLPKQLHGRPLLSVQEAPMAGRLLFT